MSADLGDYGPTDGKPVIYRYSLFYHIQGIIPWLLLPFAFVALKENRTLQGAWILAPIMLLGLTYATVTRLLQMTSGSLVQLDLMFTIMIVGFSLIWLLAERIKFRSGSGTLVCAALVYFGFLGVNLLCNGLHKDIIAVATCAAVSIPPILFAFFVASAKSRASFSAMRFLVYFGVTLFCSLLITFGMIMFIFYPIPNRVLSDQLAELLLASFLSGLIYFTATLPFLILPCANPFWLNRFEALSGVNTQEQHLESENPNPL